MSLITPQQIDDATDYVNALVPVLVCIDIGLELFAEGNAIPLLSLIESLLDD